MRKKRNGLIALLAIGAAAAFGASAFVSGPDKAAAPKLPKANYAEVADNWQHVGETLAAYQRAERERVYIEGARARAFELYLQEVARQERARSAPPANRGGMARAPRGRTSPAVGGSCGGATNGADAYIGRESGGNPNARNPSGAWGCYQIMPATWRGSCSDLGQHGSASTEAQAACASRLPHDSWSASGPVG